MGAMEMKLHRSCNLAARAGFVVHVPHSSNVSDSATKSWSPSVSNGWKAEMATVLVRLQSLSAKRAVRYGPYRPVLRERGATGRDRERKGENGRRFLETRSGRPGAGPD